MATDQSRADDPPVSDCQHVALAGISQRCKTAQFRDYSEITGKFDTSGADDSTRTLASGPTEPLWRIQ